MTGDHPLMPELEGRLARLKGTEAACVFSSGYLANAGTIPTFVGDDVIRTEAGLINHTWGTELMLDVTGLAAGTTYDVVYRTSAGRVSAGSLLAVDGQLMKCRFNAASLRSDVRQIAVVDPAGADVLVADLPTAGA